MLQKNNYKPLKIHKAMRKILFVLFTVLLIGCSKDDVKETTATVMVNVSYKYEDIDDKKLADPSFVSLYKEKVSEFDLEKSVLSMTDNQKMNLKNGELATPKYKSNDFVGVNILENIEKGNYTLIAYYKPDGYSWSMFYYFGYKEISATDLKQHNIVFTWNVDAGKFVRK